MDIKHEVARSLLSIEAVFLRPQEPFTWASGIKSPIYCDNRLILTAPDVRTEVETASLLGCSVSTVKSQTRHALERLRVLAPDLAATYGHEEVRP